MSRRLVAVLVKVVCLWFFGVGWYCLSRGSFSVWFSVSLYLGQVF